SQRGRADRVSARPGDVTGKAYLLVEGHGEVAAAANLVARLTRERGSPLVWAHSLRWKNLHQRSGLEKGAGYVRAVGDAGAILILRDEDDACPKARAPEMASWLRAMSLPFPSAIVLLHPEYEVLFLPCLEQLAGKALEGPAGPRPGLMRGTQWTGPWEAKRG